VNSNRLSEALRNYQLSTAGSALDAIHRIGEKSGSTLFAPSIDRISEFEKLESQKADLFSLKNKSK